MHRMRKSRLDAPNTERMCAEKVLKCSRCEVRHSLQMEEISGSQEVTGSTPVFSTIKTTIYGGFLLYNPYILWLSNICQNAEKRAI